MKKFEKIFLCTFLVAIFMMNTVFGATGENIMMAGEDIEASGIANGLFMLVGDKVKSLAEGDYAFIAGDNVVVSGNISKDAFIVANELTIEEAGVINRDIFVCASKVIVKGAINRNIYVVANELTIGENGAVRGDIKARVNSISIDGNALVSGTVQYNSTATASIPEGIGTDIVQVEVEDDETSAGLKSYLTNGINGIITSLVTFILLSLLATALFAKVDKMSDEHRINLGAIIGVGALELIFVPVFCILLMFTIYTVPFAFVLLLGFISVCIIATVISAYLIGKLIFKDAMNGHISAIIVLIVLELLYLVPVVGAFVYLISLIIALGTLTMVLIKDRSPRKISDEAENTESVESTENADDGNNSLNNDEDKKE